MLPQVLVKGGDWRPDAIVGRAEVEAAGGLVVSIPVVEGFSTSSLIQAALRAVTSRSQDSGVSRQSAVGGRKRTIQNSKSELPGPRVSRDN
jgi:hypothetical protein